MFEKIRRKLDTKEEERLESREIDNKGGKNNNNLKEKIDEKLKSIERSLLCTQNDSLAD